jgi:hypothetical protein
MPAWPSSPLVWTMHAWGLGAEDVRVYMHTLHVHGQVDIGTIQRAASGPPKGSSCSAIRRACVFS